MHSTGGCGPSPMARARSARSRRARMRISAALAPLLPLIAPALPCAAQQKNPQIEAIVSAIQPARIEARIRKLASFHTRHTLSRTDSDTQGIGAARRWIKSELDACSKAAGGRLPVAFDAFMQQSDRRVPNPVEIVNVVATLPGTQSPERTYVVSGHYASLPSHLMDPHAEPPGAN